MVGKPENCIEIESIIFNIFLNYFNWFIFFEIQCLIVLTLQERIYLMENHFYAFTYKETGIVSGWKGFY